MAGAIGTHKGTVTWFSDRRGFGFITPEDGGENLFVHQSSIMAVGYRSLAAGEAVEFVVSVGDDGRKRAISVTGPGGAYIEGRRYFDGVCYRCGEVGHMAMYCKSNIGPCYNCGEMGHLAWECSATQIKSSSPRRILLKEEEEDIDVDEQEFPSGKEERNWAELPRDVLWVIFKKIAALEIIRSAQFVCRPWRMLSHEPELWRCIDITIPVERMDTIDLESMAMIAVDRSQGCLEAFYLECFESECDELMCYISGRAPKLQHLRLISIHGMSEIALVDAVKKFPTLEELEISFCFFSAEVVELVGLACPQLKSFKLNAQPYMDQSGYGSSSDDSFDAEALAIAMHMRQLHRLQLIGNGLTNIGLLAILNNCPNLQYLDIRGCLNVNLDENLKKKCAMIKELRLPQDSTDDFEFKALIDGLNGNFDPTLSDSEYDFYYGHSDYYYYDGYSDMSYDDLSEFCY